MRRIVLLVFVIALAIAPALAQDPVKVDAKHYKVVVENEKIRVLRITYGPHEKSVMHDHPDSLAVFFTDQHIRFGLPGGKSETVDKKKGDAEWMKAGKHNPENLSDKPLELILVEFKSPAPAKSAAAPKSK